MHATRNHTSATRVMFWISLMEMEDSRIAYKASKLYSESSGISNWPHRVLQWWKEDTFVENLSKKECTAYYSG